MNPIESLINGIVSLIFKLIPQPKPSDEKLRQTKLVAHRGVHEANTAIENTLAAFQLCRERKIWGAELDVRLTKDLIPVIHHDPHLGRLFGPKGKVIAEMLFKDLRNVAPEIPTLQEVALALGGQVHLMVEIKEDYRSRPDCVAKILEPLKSLQPSVGYHLLCLNPDFLTAFADTPAAAKMDVIWLSPQEILAKNYELHHGSVAGHFLFLSDAITAELRQHQKQFGVGFLDSRNSLYRELNRGADWIFTNHPLRLRKYLPD